MSDEVASPPSHLQYKQKAANIVSDYLNAPGKDNMLEKTGLLEGVDLEGASLSKKYTLAKQVADSKLGVDVVSLKLDDIDKQLADLVETCSAHTSLKLGTPQFKMAGDGLESFNYSGDGKPPKSSVIMRDARFQDQLKQEGVYFSKVAADTPDTHIAVMAGQARGAIALIDKSTMTADEKKAAKQECIELLKQSSTGILTAPEDQKKKGKIFAGEVKDFTAALVKKLQAKQITIDNGEKPQSFKSEEDIKKALGTARDLAMMNTDHDHCHVVTIHPEVQGKHGFSISAIADPIPEELRKGYKAIKDDVDKPKWYTAKSPLEQEMIKGNIDRYLSGKCVLSSQDRTAAGVVNYYAQVEGVVNSNGKVEKSLIASRGTWGARKSGSSTQDIAAKCAKHIAGAVEGKDVVFQNVASSIGTSAERKMHKSMKKATKDIENCKYRQNGLNMMNLFGRAAGIKKIGQGIKEMDDKGGLMHVNCMSSKDRTSFAIMMGAMKTLHGEAKEAKNYFSSMMRSGHNEMLASRQGGTPGVFAVKLKDTMKTTIGLGQYGKMYKALVDRNSSVAKLNKVKTTKTSLVDLFRKKTAISNSQITEPPKVAAGFLGPKQSGQTVG
ncbi:MAG: hypothetical protein K9G11_00640 [Rickettsiaceae bacterium]|nr:hypothetical protein [Rickettsiaceae bacterium]